jgi:alpha-glucosidase
VDRAAHRLASVHHDGSCRYVVPLGDAGQDRLRIGDEVRLRLRAGLDAPVERVFLRTTPDGEQVFTELRMAQPGPASRWWETTLRLAMPTTGYRFLLLTPDGHWWLNGSGLHREAQTDHLDFRLVAGFDPPSWLADRVFYQVFPDRFANGDPGNDPPDGAWTYRGQTARHRGWGEEPVRGPGAMVEFFGGDLTGLEHRLDHLVDVGVNAVYLNPVFGARSNHGYDTIDYGHVADHFGGDAALVSLRRATRERDIRLILDIAPNHTGAEHPWFLEAQASPDAPSAGYYVFRQRPHDYESWLGVRSLPKLDYRSARLRETMYRGPSAILRHWLRPPFAVDGWRLDVANMLGRLGPDQLGHDVARGIRAAVKEENPDAYLMGEHSFDATESLAGDQWDGVMNYAGFATPVLEWLNGVAIQGHGAGVVLRTGRSTSEELIAGLDAFRAVIPWAVARCQYNLLDSHDTARLRSAVGGADGRVRAALGLLLTYVGVPSILYGDEIGLDGANELEARRTMPWEQAGWDVPLLGFVRSLVRCRLGSGALQRGGFQVLDVGVESVAFLRDTDDEQVVVVAARDARPGRPIPVAHGAIADGTPFASALTGDRAVVANGCLPVPAMAAGIGIWVARQTESAARDG